MIYLLLVDVHLINNIGITFKNYFSAEFKGICKLP
jgi:hypothetical protein